jgi:hypothetical protein
VVIHWSIVDQTAVRATCSLEVFFSPWLLQKEEGSTRILTVALDGGSAVRFGLTAGRGWWWRLVLDGEELGVWKRRNYRRFWSGVGSGCSWAAFIGRGDEVRHQGRSTEAAGAGSSRQCFWSFWALTRQQGEGKRRGGPGEEADAMGRLADDWSAVASTKLRQWQHPWCEEDDGNSWAGVGQKVERAKRTWWADGENKWKKD